MNASTATNGPTATRVLIADDHELMRSGLRVLLERSEGVEVVGEAASTARTWS